MFFVIDLFFDDEPKLIVMVLFITKTLIMDFLEITIKYTCVPELCKNDILREVTKGKRERVATSKTTKKWIELFYMFMHTMNSISF